MIEQICAFGDSIFKGVVFDTLRGKYTFLKNSFANILGVKNGLMIDNYSKFGCTVGTGVKIIERHSSDIPKYRYTALEFGGNDCDFDWKAISERPDDEHFPKTPIDEFEKTYSNIIDNINARGSRPVLFSLPPLNAPKYFAWISRGLNADNILKWLGDVEHIYRWHEMYNIAVMKLAASKNVPLIDIRNAFLKCRNYQSLFCEDGIHPNEAGHALISNVITDYIKAFAV
jgi:lysophospholipase L1-like esterase